MNPREDKIQETIAASKAAFFDSAQQHTMHYFEFMFVQTAYIRKRWWLFQAAVLILLWQLLSNSVNDLFVRQSMGVLAPLFAILMLPELWKNRSNTSVEIENASYYSLRQIYAARMLVFALVDFSLLCLFSGVILCSAHITFWDILVHFMLPMMITCCIIFRTLSSRHIASELLAMLLCLLAAGIWLQIVSNNTLYEAISLPVWLFCLILSACYLAYCIYRSLRQPAVNVIPLY